jgi:hypothetical protein
VGLINAAVAEWLALAGQEPIPGCPNRIPGIQVAKEAHPYAYAQMPTPQHAIARLKRGQAIRDVVRLFRTDPHLRQWAADPATAEDITMSQILGKGARL